MIGKNYSLICCEDISLIENYTEAVNSSERWQCHHRNEEFYTRNELIEMGLYYHRPAAELIFLSETEHKILHGTKDRLGDKNPMYGKHFKHSEESKRKIGTAHKGLKFSDETRKHLSEVHKGKVLCEEWKKNIGAASKRRWDDPEYRKRLKKHWRLDESTGKRVYY